MIYIFSKKSIDLKKMTKQTSIARIKRTVLSIFLIFCTAVVVNYCTILRKMAEMTCQ